MATRQLHPTTFLNKDIAILNEFQTRLLSKKATLKDFPESLILKTLDNTWHDSANAVINNWVGCVYQTTNENIAKPFMSGIDPTDPLNIKQ